MVRTAGQATTNETLMDAAKRVGEWKRLWGAPKSRSLMHAVHIHHAPTRNSGGRSPFLNQTSIMGSQGLEILVCHLIRAPYEIMKDILPFHR